MSILPTTASQKPWQGRATIGRYPFTKCLKLYRINRARRTPRDSTRVHRAPPPACLVLPRLPSYVDLGRGSYLNDALDLHCFRASHTLVVGAYSSLGACTFLVDGDHDSRLASTYPFREFGLCAAAPNNEKLPARPPRVGNDVWIADGAVIMGGVTVGDGAVVGAHAVVARDVPPYAVVVGNPARIIRYRFDPATVSRFLAVRWWDLPEAEVHEELAPLLADPPAFLAAAERLRARCGTCGSYTGRQQEKL